VDDSIVKRILHLLDWKWTKDELDTYIRSQTSNNEYIEKENREAWKIANGDTSIYRVVKDSIRIETTKRVLRHMEDNKMFSVSKNVILAAGQIGLKKAIPILEEALKDSIHYHPEYVELALAKLGKKEMVQKVLSDTKYDPKWVAYDKTNNRENDWITHAYGGFQGKIGKISKLLYLATQESIYQIHYWMDTSRSILPPKHQGMSYPHPLYDLLFYTLPSVFNNKDFQSLEEWEFIGGMVNYDDATNERILKVQNWLIRNKGKYKIKLGFCPFI
jgi:hypothetical protein